MRLWENSGSMVRCVELEWLPSDGTERRRASLPTYPFERQSYWVGAHPDAVTQKIELRGHFKVDVQGGLDHFESFEFEYFLAQGAKILLFDEASSAGTAIAEVLRAGGCHCSVVRRGEAFKKDSESLRSLPE